LSGIAEQFKDFMANFEKGQLVGLDIGLSAVKVLLLSSPKKNVYRVDHYASIELSEAAIIEDEVQKPEEIIDAITQALDKAGIKKRIISLGMDGPNTMTKRLQVPDGSKEDLEDNILWESEQYISFGAEDSEIDFHILSQDKEQDIVDALVAATRIDIAENYMSYVKDAGLICKVVDLNVIALVNIFEIIKADNLEVLDESGAIIIDFGAQTTTIIVYRNGGPILTKEINLGGVLITEEIQRQMGVSYVEAEDLKTHGDEKGNLPEEIVEIIDNKIESLLSEIKKVLNFYISTGSSEQIEHCFITGGGCKLPSLKESLSELVNIDVEYLNPFEVIGFDKKKFDDDMLDEIGTMGLVAMGLGLRKV